MGLMGVVIGVTIGAIAGIYCYCKQSVQQVSYGCSQYYNTFTRAVYHRRRIWNKRAKHQAAKKKRKPRLEKINTLEIYRPNESLLESLKENKGFLEEDFIRQKLSGHVLNIYNVHEVFKSLIELEDVDELRSYQRLIQKDVWMLNEQKTKFKLYLVTKKTINMEEELTPYCDEVVVLPNQARNLCNMVELLAPGNDGIFFKNVGIITDVNKNVVSIDFYNSNHIKDIKVDLIFRPRREYIRYQQKALQLLANNIQIREFLFPNYDPTRIRSWQPKNLKLLNETISKNTEQLEAVQRIVSGLSTQAPYIVFGPPGTGKTTTIAEAILQLRLELPQSRILVTSASNSACDTIALRLCEYIDKSEKNKFGILSLLRFYFDKYEENKFEDLPLLRIYSKGSIKDGMTQIPKRFSQSKTKITNLYWDENKHEYPTVEDVAKYKIVVMTLCTLGKYELSNFCASMRFSHIFIDEAGSMSEPEALIGIMSVMSIQKCQVILSGDHKQLGPVIKSKAKDLGLGKSLMERLMENECYRVQKNGQYDKNFQMRLKRNYRSNPEIVNLYNDLYYNNELIGMQKQNAKRNWSFLKNPQSSIAFQPVYGSVIKQKTTSSSNNLEIEVVMSYIRLLLEHDGIHQTDIGIVTPYKLQCKLIENYLKKENLKEIEVGTVEQYQGREKLIIIASMVRSYNGLGFVNCPQRWNVLLSRPISLLLIIGNPVTMNRFADMKYVIDQCELAGNYMGKQNLKLLENSKIQIVSSVSHKSLY